MEHFREEDKKSTVTLERQDHKNQTVEVEHDIIPEFWPKNQKANFRPKSQPKSTDPHGQFRGQTQRHDIPIHFMNLPSKL
jgi:hypothetical protein